MGMRTISIAVLLAALTSAQGGCEDGAVSFLEQSSLLFEKYGRLWTGPSVLTRPDGRFESAPSLTDVNGDGYLDMGVSSHSGGEMDGRTYGGSIGIHQVRSTDGTAHSVHSFRPMEYRALSLLPGADKHGHALADFDGDGLTDMMVSVGGGLGGNVM